VQDTLFLTVLVTELRSKDVNSNRAYTITTETYEEIIESQKSVIETFYQQHNRG